VDIETSDVPVNCDVVISDDGALIQSLTSEPSCSTFGDCSSVAFAARVQHELENIPNKLHKEKLFSMSSRMKPLSQGCIQTAKTAT